MACAEAPDGRTFDDDGPDVDTLTFYNNESPDNKALIDATADDRATGKPATYPEYFNPKLPLLVRSQTLGEIRRSSRAQFEE
jgi:hypothetical protein